MGNRYSCPACNSTDVKPSFQKENFDIRRCARCGSLFVYNVPDPQMLGAIYASNVYYELPPESVERIREENQRRLKTLMKLGISGHLLDIGCARGLLLDDAQDLGFKTYGTELSEKNVEICRQNRHNVIKGSIQNIVDIPRGNFDVITCLDVIEHVEEPFEFLSKLKTLLSDTGIMIITTPNYSGLVSKVLGQRDPFIIPPEHLNFFTRAGMQALFSNCDLKIERNVTFGRLTTAEKERSISKYLPKYLSPINSGIQAMLPMMLNGLNLLNLGIEQEFYLSGKS